MTSAPRILHILEATWGGTRTHLLDLLPALSERGFRCGLAYSPRRNPRFPDDARHLEALGVGTWAVPMRRGPHPDDARALRALAALARGFGPHIIHAHSSKAGLLARALAPLSRVPVVYTPHCVAFDTSLPRTQRRLARWSEAALSPLSARLIAVSRAEERALSRVLPLARPRITLIRNGLDLAHFPPPSRHDPSGATPGMEPGAEGAPVTVGCFGRLCAQKNQAALLRAVSLMRSGGIRARLLLVGVGEDEAELRMLSRALGIEEQVVWVGEVADARPLYAGCDIVALPSRWEGCPYSMLEAMASSRAVVASDIAPLREILAPLPGSPSGPCGLLCPPRPQELADALATLARDPEQRQVLGAAARARIARDFTLENMVAQTARVYEEVLAGERSASTKFRGWLPNVGG